MVLPTPDQTVPVAVAAVPATYGPPPALTGAFICVITPVPVMASLTETNALPLNPAEAHPFASVTETILNVLVEVSGPTTISLPEI